MRRTVTGDALAAAFASAAGLLARFGTDANPLTADHPSVWVVVLPLLWVAGMAAVRT